MTLEQVIDTQFFKSVPNCCPTCERDLAYDNDPVAEITNAVWDYLLADDGFRELLDKIRENNVKSKRSR